MEFTTKEYRVRDCTFRNLDARIVNARTGAAEYIVESVHIKLTFREGKVSAKETLYGHRLLENGKIDKRSRRGSIRSHLSKYVDLLMSLALSTKDSELIEAIEELSGDVEREKLGIQGQP